MSYPEIPNIVPIREDMQVTTGIARASFASVIAPKPNMSDENKLEYQIVLIFPGDSPTIPVLRAVVRDAIIKKWPSKIPAGLRDPIRDASEKSYEGFEPGHFYLTCRSGERPGVIDAALKPITDPAELYSGCFVRARLSAFAYDKAGNRGVAFGLSHVQKLADGPTLTGRRSASDVFGVVVVPTDPFGAAKENAMGDLFA